MIRRPLVRLCVAFLALGFVPAPGRASDATVTIDNFTFAPQRLVIDRGTRVTWVNHDDIPHTVFSREHPADQHSPPLDTDDSYSFVFDTPGTYGFFCSLHPHMQSEVVVR
jgi:plastocyanin